MNSAEEDTPLPPEGRGRIVLAWLAFWLMGGGGAALIYILLVFAAIFFVGGVDLLSAVLAEREAEDEGAMLDSIMYTLIFIAMPAGAILGVRLWAKLMRRTGWISAERVKRMSGF